MHRIVGESANVLLESLLTRCSLWMWMKRKITTREWLGKFDTQKLNGSEEVCVSVRGQREDLMMKGSMPAVPC